MLEGIGLIEKKSKNSIQWLGAGPGCNTREITDKLLALKEELVELDNKEMELDQHFSWAKQSIHNITDDSFNRSMAFLTQEDVNKAFDDQTLLIIQAPIGTQLEVPLPEHDSSFGFDDTNDDDTESAKPSKRRRYQIHLKSRSGPINVVLVNKSGDSSETEMIPINNNYKESNELSASIEDISIQSLSPEKSPKKSFTEIKPLSKPSVETSEKESTHSHGTRSSTRSATKPDATVSRQLPKRGAAKSVKEPVKSSAPITEEPTPSEQTTVPPVLRQLSPRKAAQQHLFVTTTRSQAQKATSDTKGTTKERTNRSTKQQTKTIEEPVDVAVKPEINEATKARMPLAPKQMMDVDELVTPDVFAPLLRLSPPPNGRDYCFNLDANEGICDLFI